MREKILRMVKGVFGIRGWPNLFPMKCQTAFFFRERVMPILLLVNFERTILFSVKRDPDLRPFTTLTIAWKRNLSQFH